MQDRLKNNVRVRACGILIQNGQILLVGHRGMVSNSTFWSPPGGGICDGESARETVYREMQEETGIDVEVRELFTYSEFIKPPLHALELFFWTEQRGGQLQLGKDPELSDAHQLLTHVSWKSWEEVRQLPTSEKHPILGKIEDYLKQKT
ncbi:MAG: NUDIX domain-containing protein [Spirosomataceae bacterium]